MENEGKCFWRQTKMGMGWDGEDRFNRAHGSFDFIFLSKSQFNGMMRFLIVGEWNIPFCKKANRFAPAYITRFCDQISALHQRTVHLGKWEFYQIKGFLGPPSTGKTGDLILRSTLLWSLCGLL